jgi:hypothetical protein
MAVSRFVHALSLHFNTLGWSTRVRLGYPWAILAVGVFGGLLRDGLLADLAGPLGHWPGSRWGFEDWIADLWSIG